MRMYLCLASVSAWDITNAVSLGTLTANTWYHLALVRNGTSIKFYLNGVSVYSVTTSAALYYDATATPVIGGQGGARVVSAYIEDFRVVKGQALHIENFTPPTSAL